MIESDVWKSGLDESGDGWHDGPRSGPDQYVIGREAAALDVEHLG